MVPASQFGKVSWKKKEPQTWVKRHATDVVSLLYRRPVSFRRDRRSCRWTIFVQVAPQMVQKSGASYRVMNWTGKCAKGVPSMAIHFLKVRINSVSKRKNNLQLWMFKWVTLKCICWEFQYWWKVSAIEKRLAWINYNCSNNNSIILIKIIVIY